jgi:ketosteroid isomerase-like protein
VIILLAGVFAVAQDTQPPAMSANPSASTTGTAGTTTENTPVAEQLRKIEDDWAKAMVSRNVDTIRRFEAPEYVYITPDGKIRDRQEDLASLRHSAFTDVSFSDMQVRVYGDTAIVSGVGHLQGTDNGKDVSGDYRFTDVFAKQDGRWQAVHSTATKIAP